MDKLSRVQLLLGDAALQKLQNATVMVVGCGAVGTFAIEALARTGVGHIIIIDHDRVDASNINRQLIAVTSTVGQPKVAVMAARIHDINPDIVVTALEQFWDTTSDIDMPIDIVVDAIDTVESKVALYEWAAARHIPVVASMGAARKQNPSAIRVAPISKTSVCPLAAKIRRMVRERGLPDMMVVYSVEQAAPQVMPGRVFGSMVTVTGTFGLNLAGMVIDYLIRDK